MRKKLIAYVNDLFAQAPKNPQARDLHDEILLNTLDRFDEEVAAGQPEQGHIVLKEASTRAAMKATMRPSGRTANPRMSAHASP